MALVVAVGVNENREREILGFDIGMAESGPGEWVRECAAVHGLSLGALDTDPFCKPVVTVKQRDTAKDRCCEHISKPPVGTTTGRDITH